MEANIAYYCLHKLHRWPHEFLDLSEEERAYVVAAVETKMKNDKKNRETINKNTGRGKRRRKRRR